MKNSKNTAMANDVLTTQPAEEVIAASKKSNHRTKKPVDKSVEKPVEKAVSMNAGVNVPVNRIGCTPNVGYCETIIANATKADGGVLYASVPLSLMDLDPVYQRHQGPHIKKIAAEWDESKCGTLLVSYRNGRFYVVDGQHRVKAAEMRGITRLYCLIHTNWTQADEAKAFAAQDLYKYRLTGLDKLNAEIAAENPKALSVKRVCDKYGVICRPVSSTSVGVLRATDRAMRIVGEHGEEMLDDIFRLIRDMGWNMERSAYSASVLYAMRNVYLHNPNRATARANLVMRNQGHTLSQNMMQARSQYPGVTNTTESLTKIWTVLAE